MLEWKIKAIEDIQLLSTKNNFGSSVINGWGKLDQVNLNPKIIGG